MRIYGATLTRTSVLRGVLDRHVDAGADAAIGAMVPPPTPTPERRLLGMPRVARCPHHRQIAGASQLRWIEAVRREVPAPPWRHSQEFDRRGGPAAQFMPARRGSCPMASAGRGGSVTRRLGVVVQAGRGRSRGPAIGAVRKSWRDPKQQCLLVLAASMATATGAARGNPVHSRKYLTCGRAFLTGAFAQQPRIG
jgi:hypothetical protein